MRARRRARRPSDTMIIIDHNGRPLNVREYMQEIITMGVMAGMAAPQIVRDLYGLMLDYFVPNEALALVVDGAVHSGLIFAGAYSVAQWALNDRLLSPPPRQLQPPQNPLLEEETRDPQKEMFAVEQPIVKSKPIVLDHCSKGGRRGDSWKEEHVQYTKHMVYQGARTVGTQANKKRFATLGNYSVSTPLSDGVTNSILNIQNYPEDRMNSVAQLHVAALDMVTASQDDKWTDGTNNIRRTFQDPTYAAVAPFGCNAVNDANLICGLSKQHLNIRIKNITRNATPGPTVVYSTAPVMAKLYVFQMKKDYHLTYRSNLGTVYESPISHAIQNGFKKHYDVNTGSSELPEDYNQDPHVSIRENEWLEEYCTMKHAKSIALVAGQEIMLNYSLPQKQILSYKYKANSILADISGTYTYAPVVAKKGELFWYLEFIGGMNSGWLADESVRPMLEPVQLAIMTTQQFDFTLLNFSGGHKKFLFGTETLPTVVVEEVDLDAHEEQ